MKYSNIQNFINKISNSDLIMNIMRVYSIKVLMLCFGLISSILVARILGPEGRGILGVATAIAGIGIQFGNFGIHSANTYFLSKDQKILPQIIGNSFVVVTFIAGISFIICVILIFFPEISPIESKYLLAFVALYIPVQVYNMLQQNFFIAINEVKKYNILEVLNSVGYPVFIIIVSFIATITPEIAMLLTLFSCCIVIVVGTKLIYKRITYRVSFNRLLLKQCLPYGLKSYISCLLSYLVLRVDVLMLNNFLGNYETGLYTLAVNLADMVNMVAVSVSMLLFPKMAAMEDRVEKRIFLIKVLKVMALVMLVLVGLSYAFSGFAIDLLYGKEYHESIGVFRILIIGIFFWALCSILFNYFASGNNLMINILAPGVGLIINFVLNYYLIPLMGIEGAAIASLISYVIIFISLIANLIIKKSYIRR